MLSRPRQGRAGSVAVEMAIAMPVLVVLFLAAFDVIGAVTAWRRTRAAAIATAEIATNLAVQSDGTNQLTAGQAWAASTAVFAYLPSLKSASAAPLFAVTLSAVAFTTVPACSNSSCVCVTTTTGAGGGITTTTSIGSGTPGVNGNSSTACYTAATRWSSPLAQGTQQSRPCNALLLPVPNGAADSLTTLPAGLFGPYSLLVADVSYTFTPTFLRYLLGSLTFLESAYLPPRIGTQGATVGFTPSSTPPVCAASS